MEKFNLLFRKFNFLFIFILVFGACKKDKAPLSIPVRFDSTSYQTLASYDASGMKRLELMAIVESQRERTWPSSL